MDEPGQSSSSSDVALVKAFGGFQSFEKKGPSITDSEDKSSTSSIEHWKEKKQIKDTKEILERIILKHAMSQELESIGSPDATDDEEEALNRRSILNAKSTRWRIIVSKWPRDPKRKYNTPPAKNSLSALGKKAPNNAQIWGATLFDFYYVKPLPDSESEDHILSSGRALAAWMKENGEDYAKNQLNFAENEEDPYLILPYQITGLIQDADRWEQPMDDKRSWIRDGQEKGKRKRKNKKRKYWQVPQPICLS